MKPSFKLPSAFFILSLSSPCINMNHITFHQDENISLSFSPVKIQVIHPNAKTPEIFTWFPNPIFIRTMYTEEHLAVEDSNLMKIVLDANVLFRTLILSGFILDVIFHQSLRIYAPKQLQVEFLNHQQEISHYHLFCYICFI